MEAMKKEPVNKNRSKVRVYVDLFFFTLMVLVLIPQSTGIPIHEWASFFILTPFVLHLVINWKWIVSNSRKILKKQAVKTRFDYVFNWLLYMLMILVTVSGIVISEAVLPLFGVHFTPDAFWLKIHDVSANLFTTFLGIHIALHWKWIVGALGKFNIKSDAHHLTGLKKIVLNRAKQIVIILFVSVALSLLYWLLDSSQWAEGFRSNPDTGHEEASKKMPYAWLIYILPLLKITFLMSIPAFITGGVIRLRKKLFRKLSPATSE